MNTSEKPKSDLKRTEVAYRQRIEHLRKEIMEEENASEVGKREEGRL
jgi:hypothetical protein